jgi:pyruvate kinase, alpha/beta domain protein
VANAIYDGTDAIMLSGETAMGKYPIEAVRVMAKIAKETESHIDHKSYRSRHISAANARNISNQVSYSAVSTADELKARAIIAPSISGFTTRMLSKWRPAVKVYGLSPSIGAVRQMQLLWGVIPLHAKRAESTDELIDNSIKTLKAKKLIKEGDIVVVTAGVIADKKERKPATHTNTMQVEIVE